MPGRVHPGPSAGARRSVAAGRAQDRPYTVKPCLLPGFEVGYPDCLRGETNAPVVWVSWHEARAFCDWLTRCWRMEGRLPRDCRVELPSEPEWEKAARSGLKLPR